MSHSIKTLVILFPFGVRRAQISTTMNVYGNALMEAQQRANAAVVSKVLRSVGQ